MTHEEFWQECIANAGEECGATLTAEQIAYIADAAQGAHDNYGMAFYQPESPLPREIKRLESELRKEREKISCPECKGSGRIITYGGTFQSNSHCWKCHGDGKVSP